MGLLGRLRPPIQTSPSAGPSGVTKNPATSASATPERVHQEASGWGGSSSTRRRVTSARG
jgi:hypothetical protein